MFSVDRQKQGMGGSVTGSGTSTCPSKTEVFFKPWGFQPNIFTDQIWTKNHQFTTFEIYQRMKTKRAFIVSKVLLEVKEHARLDMDTWKPSASNELLYTILSYVIIMHHRNVCFQEQPSNSHSWKCLFTYFAAKKVNLV